MDDEQDKPKIKLLPTAGIGLGITGTFSWAMLEPEAFKGLLTAAWREDVFRWLVAFFIAGVVHRFIFRKDIQAQLMKIVAPVVDALNKVADSSSETAKQFGAMNETILKHGDILTDQGKRLMVIEQHLTPRKDGP